MIFGILCITLTELAKLINSSFDTNMPVSNFSKSFDEMPYISEQIKYKTANFVTNYMKRHEVAKEGIDFFDKRSRLIK